MNEAPTQRLPPSPPRAVAISGLIFAVLYVASIVLVRLAIPANSADPGAWLSDESMRHRVRFALNLVPFTGLAFLWFMAVLRNRIGLLEDRFFATVFLGSGLLFTAMLFTTVAVSRGLLETFGSRDPGGSEAYQVARVTAHALMNTFATKMAAVFMFVTSTIGLRTSVLSRWISFVGFLCAIALLLVVTDFAWIALVFPAWVLLVSAYILITDFRQTRPIRPDLSTKQ